MCKKFKYYESVKLQRKQNPLPLSRSTHVKNVNFFLHINKYINNICVCVSVCTSVEVHSGVHHSDQGPSVVYHILW